MAARRVNCHRLTGERGIVGCFLGRKLGNWRDGEEREEAERQGERARPKEGSERVFHEPLKQP